MPESYRFVGQHADSLASGRAIGPLDEVPDESLTRDDDQLHPHDKALIDEGLLLPIEQDPSALTGDALKQRARDLNIEGRSEMSADEVRAAIAEAEKE